MLKYCLPGHLLSQNVGGTTEELEKPIHGKDVPLPVSQVSPSHQEGAALMAFLPFQKFPECSAAFNRGHGRLLVAAQGG